MNLFGLVTALFNQRQHATEHVAIKEIEPRADAA